MYFHPLLPLPDYRQEKSEQSVVEQHPETGTPPASGSFSDGVGLSYVEVREPSRSRHPSAISPSTDGFQLERGLHPAVDALLDRITCEGCE